MKEGAATTSSCVIYKKAYFAMVAVEKQFSIALKKTAKNLSVTGKPDSSNGRTNPTEQSV